VKKGCKQLSGCGVEISKTGGIGGGGRQYIASHWKTAGFGIRHTPGEKEGTEEKKLPGKRWGSPLVAGEKKNLTVRGGRRRKGR